MAEQPRSGLLIVGLLAALVNIPADRPEYIGEEGGLEQAVAIRDDVVAAGGIKAAEGPLRPFADGVLGLVAVTGDLGGGKDPLHRQGQPPDAGNRVGNPLLFYPQLLLVGKVLKGAAPAPAADRAGGGDAPRPWGQNLLDDAVAVGGKDLDNLYHQPVPRRGAGDKNSHPLIAAHAAPLAGNRLNLQDDGFVFLQHNTPPVTLWLHYSGKKEVRQNLRGVYIHV